MAAGTDDHPNHRRVFVLVYGLWAFTLAIGNWIKSGSMFWIALWVTFGAIAIVWWAASRGRSSGPR